jgi:hypothetical protein
MALTTTLVVPAAEVQPFTVTVTEYVPANAVVELARVGFCSVDEKPFGPVHAYVAFATVGADSTIVAPAQYGPPFDGTGAAGMALTTTLVVPAGDVQPFTVIVTLYEPASAGVAFGRVGFGRVEVKPFGPVQAYVAPGTTGVASAIVEPAQYGPPFAGDGAATLLTTTFVVPAGDTQPSTVTVTLYAPASAAVAFARVGFCCVETKPFGPVHAYVAFATVGADSAIVPPRQNGPLLLGAGAAGAGLMMTDVVPADEVHPLKSVTEYVPALAIAAFGIVGFCRVEAKPFGPLHAYVAPATVGVERAIVLPSQYGPPFVGVGVVAALLTTTVVLPASEVQPLVVTMTVYAPASAAVAFATIGFCCAEAKLFGPLQAYVAPATVGVASAIVSFTQYGPPLLAGAAPLPSTTTVVPAAEAQPLTVTVTAYVPKSAAAAFARVGFCDVEVKLFGPVHAYVAFATVGVVSEIVPPSQVGPSLLAVGVAGFGVTVTLVVPAADVQPPTVTVTEYVPASAAVAFARVGFCCVEVKPFGPVQAYIAFATAGVESAIVAPAQNGPLLLAAGVAGTVVLTTTPVVPAAEVQPPTVTVTE